MQAKASRPLHLQNNPQECFANGASLLKVRFLLKLKKVTQTKACVTFYTPDRNRTYDNPASEAGALSTELQAQIY